MSIQWPPRQHRRERALGRLGVARLHQAEAVRDAVDVGVDADGGDAEAEAEDEVGGLAADPGEGEQRVERGRHRAAVLGAERLAMARSWRALVL